MKHIICLTFAVIIALNVFSASSLAASKKNKKLVSENSEKNSASKRKNKKTSRYKKVKKSGNGPDLKALTTKSPYVEDPDNGVNSVETQPGI
jgi:nitrogen fixation protein FixH